MCYNLGFEFRIGWISSNSLKTLLEKVMWKTMQQKAKGFGLNARKSKFWFQHFTNCTTLGKSLDFSVSVFLPVKGRVCVRPLTITNKSICQTQPLQTLLADSSTLEPFKNCITNIVPCNYKCFVYLILNDYIRFYLTDMPLFI